jgi:hypothetical protein
MTYDFTIDSKALVARGRTGNGRFPNANLHVLSLTDMAGSLLQRFPESSISHPNIGMGLAIAGSGCRFE